MPIVFTGRVFSVEVDKKRFPNGAEHEVAIVRHAPAVVVIPLEPDGRVVLIRQFRAAIDRELWEGGAPGRRACGGGGGGGARGGGRGGGDPPPPPPQGGSVKRRSGGHPIGCS